MSDMQLIMEDWRGYLHEIKLINESDIKILAKGVIFPKRESSAARFFVIVEYDIKNIFERYDVRGFKHKGITNMVPEKEQVIYYASSGTATPTISSPGNFWPIGGIDYGGNVASWIENPFDGWIVKMRSRKKVDENTVAKYVADYLSQKFSLPDIVKEMRRITEIKAPGIKKRIKQHRRMSSLEAKGKSKAYHYYFDKDSLTQLIYNRAEDLNKQTVKKIETSFPKAVRYDVRQHYAPFYWGDVPLDRNKIPQYIKFVEKALEKLDTGFKLKLG